VHPIVEELRARDLVIFAVTLPAVLLPTLFLGSSLLSVEFGNVIFGLSVVTCVGWIFLNLNDRTGPSKGNDARSILSRRSRRFGDVGRASERQLLSMTRALLVFTGVVILGWAYLLAA